ncbi:MAG: aldolase [Terriglobia bacterium]
MIVPPEKSFFEQSRSDVAQLVNEQLGQLDDNVTLPLDARIAIACRILAEEGHGRTLAGQVTVRVPGEDTFCTLPFDTGFGDARQSVVLRVNGSMNVVEGSGIPNPAVRFHMWIYQKIPAINAIVHTHPPFASALSMTGKELLVAHMDATPFHDDCAYLPQWPGLPIGNDEGEIIAGALGTKRTILLAHHGLLTVGKSLEEAVYLAVLFEQAAQLQMRALAIGEVHLIEPALAKESHNFLLQPKVIQATFKYWSRQVLRDHKDVLS